MPFIFYAHTRIHTYTTCLLGLMAQLRVGLEISVVNKLGLAPLRVDKVRVQRLASTYTMKISVCVCSVFLSECVHMCLNTWETEESCLRVVCALWVRELAHTSQIKSFINTGTNVDKKTPGHCGLRTCRQWRLDGGCNREPRRSCCCLHRKKPGGREEREQWGSRIRFFLCRMCWGFMQRVSAMFAG
jgi:hypothetical protein